MGWFTRKSSRADDKADLKERVRNRNKVESMIKFLRNKGYKKPKQIRDLLIEAITEQFDDEIQILNARLGELIEEEESLKQVEAFDKIKDFKIEQKKRDAEKLIDCIKKKKKAMLFQLDVLILKF
jgi:hypothetical protein